MFLGRYRCVDNGYAVYGVQRKMKRLLASVVGAGLSASATRQASKVPLPPAANRLPARLVAHTLQYLGDALDVARSASVCKAWHLPADMEDRLWQLLFVRDFQIDAEEGFQTWKARYVNTVKFMRDPAVNREMKVVMASACSKTSVGKTSESGS